MGMLHMECPYCGERDCVCVGSSEVAAQVGNQSKPIISTDWEPRDFQIGIRTRQFFGTNYVRLEDVVAMLLEFGDCSGSQFVQARSKKLAQDILRIGREPLKRDI